MTDTVPDMEDGVSVYITRNLLYDDTVLYGTQYQARRCITYDSN